MKSTHGSAVPCKESDLEAGVTEREAAVIEGLRETPPRISPAWFYDARGSALFERICALPEYYLTRTELSILGANRMEIAAALGPDVALVEPGSGASVKTRLLLDALRSPTAYVPVDISREALHAAARGLRSDYPTLRVHPICGDFTQTLGVPRSARTGARRTVVFFPGSTLGNFRRDEAVRLLVGFARMAGPDGAVLIGLDRVKPVAIIENAYDDASGVTAAFNLNALQHMNREVRADFDIGAFDHRAVWIEAHERIEMHLVARRDTRFKVGGYDFALARRDYLLTEYSHKYTLDSAARIAAEAGLVIRRVWSDRDEWFSVLLLEA
jgi:L-histidine Nalpha-methyltransferase